MVRLNPVIIVLLFIACITLSLTAQIPEEKGEDRPIDKFAINPGGEGDNLIDGSSYPFSALTGIGLEDMSSGTTQLVGPGADDVNSALATIGFTFRFDGTNYTTFGTHSNGAVTLGQVWSLQNSQNQIQFGNFPKIMPYWDNLCTGNSGKVHYKTVGSPGSRKLVVEWLNMEIARGPVCGDPANGTFQLWLFEQTGVVQFVYGNGMTQTATNDGYSVGIQVKVASNFASVTTANSSVSYTQVNDTQFTPITAGTSYVFSPVVPTAPTNGSIADLTQTTLRLNWTDNASNETGYEVRRSTDGINYSIIAIYPPDTTTSDDAGLTPNTQYFYRVNAVSDGALSGDLSMSATTNPSRNINSTTTGGPWSVASTWAGGIIPQSGDNVTIVAGATVTIESSAFAGNLTVGGAGNFAESSEKSPEGATPAMLRFGENGTFTLAVSNDVTIGTNDSLTTGGGNGNQHVLYVGGDLINNGTLDLSTNTGLAGAGIAFNGPGDSTFGGTGAVTDVFIVMVNKASGSTVELSPTNFTVGGSAVDTSLSGYLIITSGTFKISGTFSGAHRTFPSGAYAIPANGGLWLNNPNYTITAQEGIADINGYLRVSTGVYNIGLNTDQSLRLRAGSTMIVEGGAINIAGMFSESSTNPAVPVNFTQSGGVITTCTKGSTSSEGCFAFGNHLGGGTFADFSGGRVIIQTPSQGANQSAFVCFVGCTSSEDFTVQYGNELTSQTGTFSVRPEFIPNIVLNTSGGPHTLIVRSIINGGTFRTVNIGPGGTFDIGDQPITISGESFINNGFIKGDRLNSRLIFTGNNTIYSGTGTTIAAFSSIDFRGQTFSNTATGKFRVRYMNLVSGNLVGANNFILGNNDSMASYISFGSFSVPTTVGTFDAAPEFDLGIGGQSLTYYKTGPSRTIGPELNPARHIIDFTFNANSQTDTLTITGGEVVVRNLNLTLGKVVAPSGIQHYGAGTVGDGFVYGTITRRFSAQENYTFQLGVNQRSPVVMNLTAVGGNPTYVAVGTSVGPLPGLHPSTSLNRSWTIAVNGTVTGSIRYYWENADIRGNVANYKLWRATNGPVQLMPFSLDVPSNSIAFGPSSDLVGSWGVGEQLQLAPVSVSGTVRTSGGMPIRNALVRVTGPGLVAPFVEGYTGNLGNYLIEGLQVGETYTVQVGAKRYRFTPSSQSVTPSGNATGVDFTANPQE